MYARATLSVLLLALAALATTGCSDDTNKELLACPGNGLGVKATTGESCVTALNAVTDPSKPVSAAAADCLKQMSEYEGYACAEPQICLDKTKRVATIKTDANAAAVTLVWTITNCSTGQKNLNITGLGIAGDSNCFFSAQPEIENKVIGPGKEVSMRVVFKPAANGDHNAAIYIVSDAQNYPKMILPICVRVTDKPFGGDAGTSDMLKDCTDVTKSCNETCHPGCGALIK